MKIKPKDRRKTEFYLHNFYKYYPREKYTIFHFVRYLKKRLKQNKDAWYGVSGDTGCLDKETKLRGYSLTLEELKKKYQDGYVDTFSYDFENNKVVPSVSEIVDSGKKPIYDITFENGNTVKCTKDHKFFVSRDNKILELPLEAIKEGDLLCTESPQ